jgi:hypothetical protein
MQGMGVYPTGAPVSPSVWAHFGEEKNPSEVFIIILFLINKIYI